MKTDQAKKMADEAITKLLEMLDRGKSEQLTEYLSAMARFHRYSFHNVFLICLQCPNATHVAGYHAWNRLGRYVKRNERGIAILAPMAFHRTVIPEDKEQEQDEMKEEECIGFKTAYVFDISQTDGKPLPEFAKVQGDPGAYAEKLKDYVREKKIVIEYISGTGSIEGMSCGGVIKLREGLLPAEEFSTLVHELAHEALHRECEGQQRAKTVRETEAEAVAFIVSQAAGLDTNTSSSDYIQLYQGDRKTLVESLGRIQRTASEIITAISESEKN